MTAYALAGKYHDLYKKKLEEQLKEHEKHYHNEWWLALKDIRIKSHRFITGVKNRPDTT